MTIPGRDLGLFVLLALAALPAAAQDSRRELRPEFDLYVSAGERARFVFKNQLTESAGEGYTQGSFQATVEIAMRPLFRRQLRRQPDVFRNRYLTLQAGYQFVPSVNNGNWSAENRIVAESTARYLRSPRPESRRFPIRPPPAILRPLPQPPLGGARSGARKSARHALRV
jgi:hypothetical protein